jgi:hypothetical protein
MDVSATTLTGKWHDIERALMYGPQQSACEIVYTIRVTMRPSLTLKS